MPSVLSVSGCFQSPTPAPPPSPTGYGIFQETASRTVNVSLNSDAALFCDVTGINPPLGLVLNPSDPPDERASRIIWYYANGMEAGTEVALSSSPRTVDNGKYLVFIELQADDIRSYYCGVFNPMLGTMDNDKVMLEMVDIGKPLHPGIQTTSTMHTCMCKKGIHITSVLPT